MSFTFEDLKKSCIEKFGTVCFSSFSVLLITKTTFVGGFTNQPYSKNTDGKLLFLTLFKTLSIGFGIRSMLFVRNVTCEYRAVILNPKCTATRILEKKFPRPTIENVFI